MTRRVTNRALPALIVGALLAATALAGLVVTRGDLVEADAQATTYLLSGRADIPAGQTQDDVVVARGVVTIDGTVESDVIVGSGRVRLNGVVHGDVVVVRGGARLGPEAEIDGDLRTSRPPRVPESAVVRGDVVDVDPLGLAGELPRSLWFALWLAAGLAVLAVGLLASGRATDAARTGAGRPGRAVLLGGLGLVVVPVAVAVLALSVLGIGVAVVLAGAFAVAATVGAAAAGVALGRLVGLPDGPISFLAGWLALGAGLALALLANPLLALLGAAGILAFGLGSLLPTRQHAGPRNEAAEREDPPAGASPDLFPLEEDLPPVVVEEDEPTILAAFPIGSGSRN